MTELLLHQFPISHFCEKVRWLLDARGLPYRIKNQFPGLHAAANRKLVGAATVPVLIHAGHAVGDSSAIARYLDQHFTSWQAVPGDPAQREQVLALEREFDESAGVHGRRYMYSFVLRDPRLFHRLFFAEYGLVARTLGGLAVGVLRKKISALYRTGTRGAEESGAIVERAFERVEALTDGDPARYLLGDRLTLADVTAASLLAPMVGPPGTPWGQDPELPELRAMRERARVRPAGKWVLARYTRDRRGVHGSR